MSNAIFTTPVSKLADRYTITLAKGGYLLTGKRGAVYMLIRNVNNPEAMFAVKARGEVPRVLSGWFHDDKPLADAQGR